METKYNHIEVEQGKNQKWIDRESFSKHDKNKEPFTIILPPPNVTGKLHLGHAWDTTIQDMLIRYNKLKGKDVLWLPAMDHAGIATQAKVEQRLRETKGPTRFELGREKFLSKVWEWKDEYAQTIRNQWGKLGLALDYKKERFTLDEGLSKEVSNIFIKMYEDGMIYKGLRPVNWDPQLQTVLSNIEVIPKDTEQGMFYFKYLLKNSKDFVEVATTRPETMFSDVAVAVNPLDNKMNHLIGKTAISPLNGNELPIIGDEYIKIDKGTGAMKVSAHATADIEIIQKNNLEIKESIDKKGLMNEVAGEMKGLDRFEARKRVIELIKSKDLFIKEESNVSAVGYSERSGVAVETLVSSQWFVNMKPLAEKVLDNLKSKEGVNFYPKRFENVLIQWMENIQDWCISRQLWWGHRIPAWYKNEEIKVQVEFPGEGWKQDDDVLDTWFSSGLAPFSFLGGVGSEDYNRYYPTNVLVTGYDIIFFWISRMYFQGLEATGKKPFNDVLIHGLIRAEDGRKMSKSLGNGIDPMDVIDKYGSDSLRWFLLTNSTPGQDIRYSVQKLEAAWNINNKLWNISRYILEVMEDGNNEISDADKWISNKLTSLEKFIDEKMKSYDFTIIGKELTSFIMDSFSSWYIEFSKASPNKVFAISILRRLLLLLHPFLPFITDHIFKLIDGKELLDFERTSFKTQGDTQYIDRVISVIKGIRTFRTDQKQSNKKTLHYYPSIELSEVEIKMIKRMANAMIKQNDDALVTCDGLNIHIELDLEMKSAEEDRIHKQIEFLKKEIKRAKGMLSNERFLSKAPEKKIEEEKNKLLKFEKELKDLNGGN